MSAPFDHLAEAVTGEAEWGRAVARVALVRQQGGRAAAMAAAEVLKAQFPGLEAGAWERRDGWGLAARVGGTTVAGPIGEVRAWAARQAPAGEDSPGPSPGRLPGGLSQVSTRSRSPRGGSFPQDDSAGIAGNP